MARAPDGRRHNSAVSSTPGGNELSGWFDSTPWRKEIKTNDMNQPIDIYVEKYLPRWQRDAAYWRRRYCLPDDPQDVMMDSLVMLYSKPAEYLATLAEQERQDDSHLYNLVRKMIVTTSMKKLRHTHPTVSISDDDFYETARFSEQASRELWSDVPDDFFDRSRELTCSMRSDDYGPLELPMSPPTGIRIHIGKSQQALYNNKGGRRIYVSYVAYIYRIGVKGYIVRKHSTSRRDLVAWANEYMKNLNAGGGNRIH